MEFFKRGVVPCAALALSLFAAPAAAQDMFFVGPKALGMAGSRVASVDDTTAIYYNPAAFGFFGRRDPQGNRLDCDNNDCGRKDWGVDLDAGAGYRLHQEFGTFLDELADIDYEALGDEGLQNDPERLEELVKAAANLAGIDDPGNAMTADANAGLGVRSGHFAVGVRAYLQGTGRVAELDTVHLGLNLEGMDLATDIQNTPLADDGQVLLFTPAQQEQLLAVLDPGGANPAAAQDALEKLDYLARQQGVSGAQLDQAVDLLTNAVASSSPDLDPDDLDSLSLANNESNVLLTGFGLLEVPLSYGYAINDHWSVGGSLKFMLGRVYGTRIIVFDDDAEDLLRELEDDYEESANVGIDIGLMGRYKYVQFGLVGRNLNAPEFDGFHKSRTLANGRVVEVDVPDVTVDPQVRAGVAVIPHPTVTVEVDCDLTENDTTFDDYQTRYLSLGLEWDALRVLALRGGAYKNLADSDIDWVYTAGLGLNLWGARLDLAGAFTGEEEEFDGDNYPREVRLAGQFSVDF